MHFTTLRLLPVSDGNPGLAGAAGRVLGAAIISYRTSQLIADSVPGMARVRGLDTRGRLQHKFFTGVPAKIRNQAGGYSMLMTGQSFQSVIQRELL